MITVLIADDHPMVRAGLRGMLDAEADLHVVGEAASGDEAVAAVATSKPDVVLMDLRMPGVDGVAATERIAREHPDTHVLVVTTYDTDSDILRAIEAGADGYLLKDVTRIALVDAIHAAARGETVLAPAIARQVVHRARQPERPGLSARELEVLAAVARGLTNAAIGRELHISEATVKTHLLRTFAKLDVSDRTAAVTTAMSHGLLQ